MYNNFDHNIDRMGFVPIRKYKQWIHDQVDIDLERIGKKKSTSKSYSFEDLKEEKDKETENIYTDEEKESQKVEKNGCKLCDFTTNK